MTLRNLWALALCLVAATAQAAPADDASAHFKAVAAGDVDAVMGHYADQAVLQWLGGPLDGSYAGAEAIRGVWAKFAKANGPLPFTVQNVETSANPKGATVTANVVFQGKTPIKVRYVLTYRGDKLVNEVWQVDPNLAVAGY